MTPIPTPSQLRAMARPCVPGHHCERQSGEAPSTMPADLAQRITIALECGVLWTKDTEAHQRMQRALADFSAWRAASVPVGNSVEIDGIGTAGVDSVDGRKP